MNRFGFHGVRPKGLAQALAPGHAEHYSVTRRQLAGLITGFEPILIQHPAARVDFAKRDWYCGGVVASVIHLNCGDGCAGLVFRYHHLDRG